MVVSRNMEYMLIDVDMFVFYVDDLAVIMFVFLQLKGEFV